MNSHQSRTPGDNRHMSPAQSLPPSGSPFGGDAVRNLGRRTSGLTFAIMITVLLVALVFAANQNDVIGWIIVAISAGWLALAAILVLSVRRGARKVGETLDSARADEAARRSKADPGTVVVDEDAHTRNLKLDHSFKIVQVQKRVVAEELAKGEAADIEMADRALETMEITATNARDMLADLVGRRPSGSAGAGPQEASGADRSHGEDDGTISGDIVR